MNRLRRCPKELKGHEDLAASKTTTLATEKQTQEAVEGPLNSLLPESDDITETTQKLKEIKP